jgi:hypothetical protein
MQLSLECDRGSRGWQYATNSHLGRLVGVRRGGRRSAKHQPCSLPGGVLIYGSQRIFYDRFYGSLGVDPSDVGLSYTETLARSTGFVIVSLVLLVTVALHMPFVERRFRYAGRQDPTVRRSRGTIILSVLGTVLFVGVVGVIPWVGAEEAAREVQAGRPVGPIRYGLPFLAIHADPVWVEPVGKPGDSTAAERLRGRQLLYLGQSEGTVLLYDASFQRAIYVPASSIVLQVANCRAEPPPPEDDRCRGANY